MRAVLRKLFDRFRPARRWLARVDFREHEDKVLLLLALVVSALVGLIIVAFVFVTEHLGVTLLTGPVQRLLFPVIGSLVGGWLLFRFFPDARGSGILQTRVALLLHNGVISLRTVIGKFICSSISLGSGVAARPRGSLGPHRRWSGVGGRKTPGTERREYTIVDSSRHRSGRRCCVQYSELEEAEHELVRDFMKSQGAI